ncbi:hypothetical protein JOF35_008586 [Streptomyces demainii]|uniref:Uncharacterized protein n=1 Tax=Streptomyces demainii TaxID=588122 RepID=A0ABT9L6B3_9ACTN|nr:hypothetical protein [Streptomyces demainii]
MSGHDPVPKKCRPVPPLATCDGGAWVLSDVLLWGGRR